MQTNRQIHRSSRRPISSFLAAVAIAAPLVAGCGFDMATDRPYTQAAGDNDVAGDQDVLNAIVVATADGSGTFVATLANNDQQAPVTFEGLQATEAGAFDSPEVSPVEIAPGGAVNLATDGGVKIRGEFELGDFLGVTVSFDDGSAVSVDAPVVPNEGQWEGLDVPEPSDIIATPVDDEAPSDEATPTERARR